jgi:hypothetical protein
MVSNNSRKSMRACVYLWRPMKIHAPPAPNLTRDSLNLFQIHWDSLRQGPTLTAKILQFDSVFISMMTLSLDFHYREYMLWDAMGVFFTEGLSHSRQISNAWDGNYSFHAVWPGVRRYTPWWTYISYGCTEYEEQASTRSLWNLFNAPLSRRVLVG